MTTFTKQDLADPDKPMEQTPPEQVEEIRRLMEERRKNPVILDIKTVPKCYEGWNSGQQGFGLK